MARDWIPNPTGNPNWRKGMPSPNPSGRTKGLNRIIDEVIGEDGFAKAMQVLADIAYGKLAPACRMPDRLKAIEMIFDRKFGKPVQAVKDVSTLPDSPTNSRLKEMTLPELMALRSRMMQGIGAGEDTTPDESGDDQDESPAAYGAIDAQSTERRDP